MSEINEGQETPEESKWDKVEAVQVSTPLWNPFTLLITCLVVGLGAAALFHFLITPYFETRSAQNTLNNVTAQRGNLIAVNTDVVTFQGQKIETATIDQKALSHAGNQEPGAVFIFGNNKPGKKKVVEVFLDFKSQRSRDFMLLNHNSLKGMIESGLIELHVLPVPTGNAFGVYAAEAVAETFASQPDKAWKVMYELLRRGSAVDADNAKDVAEKVSEIVKDVTKNDAVTVKTIQAGKFSSWMIAVGKDTRLSTGFYPPMIYIDGNLVNPEEVNINSPETFREAVIGK